MLARVTALAYITLMTTTQITVSSKDATVTYSAATDARIKSVSDLAGYTVYCRSQKAADELESEARAWGISSQVAFVRAYR